MVQIILSKPTNNKMIFSFDGKLNLVRQGSKVVVSKSNTYLAR
ncbi:hypothetical protein [Priestia megaterium]|nr:hypothetical protein [Priestia megaterium]